METEGLGKHSQCQDDICSLTVGYVAVYVLVQSCGVQLKASTVSVAM